MSGSSYYEQAFLLPDGQTMTITFDYMDGSGCGGKIVLSNKVRSFTRTRQKAAQKVLDTIAPYITNVETEGEEYE